MRTCRNAATAVLFGLLLFSDPAIAQNKTAAPFSVGLRIFEFEYAYPDGRTRMMTTAVWYPTHTKPEPYTYPEHTPVQGVQTVKSPRTTLALDANPATKEGPFPFVFFAHGGFGCATNSAFFTEYLARQGFVAAACDFEDTIPPDFTRQLAFSRLGQGNVAHPLLMLRVIGKFVEKFNADRSKALWYMNRFRWAPARFVIEQVLKEGRDVESPLNGLIDDKAVGMMGHSLGGLTTLGVIGPNPGTHEKRIKAALIFSAPVYPLEKNLDKIRIPVLTMYGDNDPNALGPDHPRSLLYKDIKAPRFEMILRNANHFTFGNPQCDDLSVARKSNLHARLIQDYGLAFFKRYLKGDRITEKVLGKTDPGLVHYKCEMTPGKELVWGKPPNPKGDGSAGGIREEIRKRMRRSRPQRKSSARPSSDRKEPGPVQRGYQPSGRYKVKVIKDISYYTDPDADPKKHKLDLYLPEGAKDFPVLMFIHGGGWKMGDKDQAFGMYGKLARAFAQEGIGAVIISYRLSPQVIHPEHIKDCARAFAWVHERIPGYGGRKDQIFVTGQSAGGHLCALLATNGKYLKEHGLSAQDIKGVIPISGVYRIFSNLFRAFGRNPANWRDASPIQHVKPGLPPFLIIVGDRDFPGADLMAQNFAKQLRAQGNTAELKTIANRTHITIITKVGTAGDPTTAEMLRFIREHSGKDAK